MNVMVLGGAGFIGSHLVDRLMAEGNSVTVYDNLSSGSKKFVEHHFKDSRFHFVQADILDLDTLNKAISGTDVVFHLAANPDARAGTINTRLDLELNTLVTYNVLESMRKNNVRKLIFTSSGCVYGELPYIPIDETYGPLKPISLYGASKLACEGLISAFCALFDMQAWIFRPGNVVGPRATHGVMFDLIKKLVKDSKTLEVLGDGNQTKPYIHVDDCIDGMLFGFQNGNEQVNILNLAVSSGTGVNEIVNLLLEMTGNKKTKVKFTGGKGGWRGDVPMVRIANRKLEQFGWKPRYTSDEAVRATIQSLITEQYGVTLN
jgi:UDP-glucose 4-epimerase